MIISFRCKETERIYNGKMSKKLPQDIQPRSFRKLRQIDASRSIEDLKNPPGNMLETLEGDRKGQMSIRVNGQWRICFNWSEAGAENVEIVDYH